MRKVQLAKWEVFFNDLRPRMIRETSPRVWPSYQRMILALCLDDIPDCYREEEERPEVTIVRNSLKEFSKTYKDDHEGVGPSDTELKKQAKKYAKEAVEIVGKLLKTPLDRDSVVQKALRQ
jgi:hypothetical protein